MNSNHLMKTLLVTVALCLHRGSYSEFLIKNPSLTSRGIWKPLQSCPENTFVVAFDLTSYTYADPFVDDSAGIVNIVFQCSALGSPEVAKAFISTDVGGVSYVVEGDTELNRVAGSTLNVTYEFPLRGQCEGVAIGFQINSEEDQGSDDNSGLNNLRLFCSGLRLNVPDYVEGYGDYRGIWTTAHHCGLRQSICGVQSQVVDLDAEDTDRIGVENLRFRCCDLPNPAKRCIPTADWEILETTPSTKNPTAVCNYSTLIGVGIVAGRTASMNQEYVFNERTGYSIVQEQGWGWVNSALFENILSNLGSTLGYNWSTAAERSWYEVSRYPDTRFDCGGGSGNPAFFKTVQIYQLVAKCSYFSVRAGWFKKIETMEYPNVVYTNETYYGA